MTINQLPRWTGYIKPYSSKRPWSREGNFLSWLGWTLSPNCPSKSTRFKVSPKHPNRLQRATTRTNNTYCSLDYGSQALTGAISDVAARLIDQNERPLPCPCHRSWDWRWDCHALSGKRSWSATTERASSGKNMENYRHISVSTTTWMLGKDLVTALFKSAPINHLRILKRPHLKLAWNFLRFRWI